MNRIRLTLLMIAGILNQTIAQNRMIALQKNHRTIQRFWVNSEITFRTGQDAWLSGIITRITPDSFYFTRQAIHRSVAGIDTVHFSGYRFRISDITVMPTVHEIVNNIDGDITVIPGHEKFVWIRNGFIFKVLGAGYLALNLGNAAIQGDNPFNRKNSSRLAIAAAALLSGFILSRNYEPHYPIGRKFKLIVIDFGEPVKGSKPF